MTLVKEEPIVKYHPCFVETLTLIVEIRRQCLVGSLTGAVASQNVTEVPKGWLNTVGNRVWSVKA